MATAQVKQPLKQESIFNGKTLAKEQSSNGTTPPKTNASSISRKTKRKEWWDKNKKLKGGSKKQNNEDNIQAANIKSQSIKEESGDQSSDGDSPKSKLRNREAIAKPDSLKYEPDFNRGFHSKIMQNLHVEPSKSKKKKSKKERQEEQARERAAKRKAASALGSPQDNAKKTKTTEEPEVFDSYKFSLNLINGEVDTSKSPAGKDSKDKYVLFIGNLPYDITREQLEEHFRKTGGIKAIRIPREKGTDKGRGFAYMEFDGRISHGIALRLHQTTLGGRKINVEFTSIGGGKSEARKEKLQIKNKKRRKMKMHY